MIEHCIYSLTQKMSAKENVKHVTRGTQIHTTNLGKKRGRPINIKREIKTCLNLADDDEDN